jgi:hypothetical protein
MVAVEELLTRGGKAVKYFIDARKSTEDEARQALSIDAQLDGRPDGSSTTWTPEN